jgi:hypothetical protein
MSTASFQSYVCVCELCDDYDDDGDDSGDGGGDNDGDASVHHIISV